ncbi:MAG: HAMP domain-containing sensor histidine kinase [Actinomycetota bacterium]
MRSLLARLSTFTAIGALVLAVVAVVGVSIARSEEASSRLDDELVVAAFRLSDDGELDAAAPSLDGGTDVVEVVFDDQARIVRRRGPVTPEIEQVLREEVWEVTVEQDVANTIELEDPALVAVGVRCVDADDCDTAVVAARRSSTSDQVRADWPWLVAVPSIAAAIAWLASRWLVTRALRPVDRMRAELDEITATDLRRRVPTPGTGDELDRLGTSMNQTLDRLAGAVEANERFVGDAAHELRSPITGVRAALELEAGRSDSGLLDDSIAELDRAGRLIDDLLALARRQGREQPRTDIDLDDVVARQIGIARTRFPDVSIDADLVPVRVHAAPDDVDRIVANVVENAARHGGGRVRVRLTTGTTAAELSVDDDGPGIPPEDRHVVFERFARLDASRSRLTGGAGLGLAIVAELVEDLGGSVEIADSDLGGAAFGVLLPLDAQPT